MSEKLTLIYENENITDMESKILKEFLNDDCTYLINMEEKPIVIDGILGVYKDNEDHSLYLIVRISEEECFRFGALYIPDMEELERLVQNINNG